MFVLGEGALPEAYVYEEMVTISPGLRKAFEEIQTAPSEMRTLGDGDICRMAPRWAVFAMRLLAEDTSYKPWHPDPLPRSSRQRFFDRIAATPDDMPTLITLCAIVGDEEKMRDILQTYARTGDLCGVDTP